MPNQTTATRPSSSDTRQRESRERAGRVGTENPGKSDSADAARRLLGLTDDLLAEIDEILEPHPDKPFTLADAIREGAKMTSQAFGQFQSLEGETCALGSAAIALQARGFTFKT